MRIFSGSRVLDIDIRELRNEIESTGATIAQLTGKSGVSTSSLSALVAMFGTARVSVLGASSRFSRDEPFYEVRSRNRGRGIRDDRGVVIISSTPRTFALHTDSYNAEVPPRIVMLQCIRQGQGGTSLLLPVSTLVNRLSPFQARTLSDPVFPTRSGVTRLLARDDSGTWIARANLYELDACVAVGANVSLLKTRHWEALCALRAELATTRATVRRHLAVGEVLILDNARMLHGRTRLRASPSTRVLRRAWVDLG